MSGPTGAIMRAVLATKLGHVRQAVESYAQDRLDQSKGVAKGYAIGSGLYVAAGIFLIAAIFVGAAALFRWIEGHYGANIAFGSIGGGLVLLALVCALSAAGAMRPPKKNLVSLASRLRVAIRVNPKSLTKTAATAQTYAPGSGRDHVASARNTATAILREGPGSASASRHSPPIATRAGVAMAVTLLGWALARRYSQIPRQIPRPVQATRARH